MGLNCVQVTHANLGDRRNNHNSFYYHHQIGSINLTHCFHIFPWLCVWDCTVIFCHSLLLHSGITGVLFLLLLCSLWCVWIFGYSMARGLIHLFIHYTISLPSFSNLIERHWTYEMPGRYILSSVWVKLSKFSHLSLYNLWGCMHSVYPIPYDDCENTYALFYFHHQIGSMNYLPIV